MRSPMLESRTPRGRATSTSMRPWRARPTSICSSIGPTPSCSPTCSGGTTSNESCPRPICAIRPLSTSSVSTDLPASCSICTCSTNSCWARSTSRTTRSRWSDSSCNRSHFCTVSRCRGRSSSSPFSRHAALLKYRVRDVVKDVLRIRSPGVPTETRQEIEWLEARTTIARVRIAVEEHRDVLPPDPICTFLERLGTEPRSGLLFLRLRSQLRHALRPFRRRRSGAALLAYARAGWRRRQHLSIHRPDVRMAPQSGGATIALVGSDGSGKSTTAGALDGWLGWKLQTGVRYMGSKAPSQRSRLLYVGFRALRRTHRATANRLGPGSRRARPVAEARDVLHALHYLSIGRDRARRYRARTRRRPSRAGRHLRSISDGKFEQPTRRPPAGRAADRERVAAAGRAPGAEVGADGGTTLRTVPAPGPSHRADRRARDRVARKPDHEQEVLPAKCRAAIGLAAMAESRPDVHVARVDANRSADAVLSEVKSEVWRAL